MTDSDPQSDPRSRTPASVSVRVTRSGGIAGLRREWCAEADGPEAARWAALIERCAWDDDAGDAARPTGADRFTWGITARCDDAERSADLPEARVHGPWRELVDEVRARGRAQRPPTPN